MDTNYWKEYWDNYYKFMAVYLGGIQEAYPDADMRSEYTEVASLFEPVMPSEEDMNYEPYNNGAYNNGPYNNNGQYNNGPYNNGQYNDEQYNDNGQYNDEQYNDEQYNDEQYNNESDNNNSETDDNVNDVEVSTIPFAFPGGEASLQPFTFPGGGPPFPPGQGQSPQPFISPGGGKFTINNCRRMAIVRIEMRRGFSPSNFFMVVDRADRRSIQGYRISCEGSRIRFVPMAVDYRNINRIECAF